MTDGKLGKGALALISALAMAVPVGMVAGPASAYVFGNVRIEGNQRLLYRSSLSFDTHSLLFQLIQQHIFDIV